MPASSPFRVCAASRRLLLGLVCTGVLTGQTSPDVFTYRGFLDTTISLFPQSAPGDSGRVIGESLFRWEGSYTPTRAWKLNAGFDAQTDTHRQFERSARLDWQDRSLQRPSFSLRRLSAAWNARGLTIEAGKQIIRWGKADILNPTDRFAPRDFLNVIRADFLPVLAVRATYERGPRTLDLVYTPRMTPSRTPLLNQRWVLLPELPAQLRVVDLGAEYPGGPQFGARYNHIGSRFEYSLSFFDGYNHLPLVGASLDRLPIEIGVRRIYPALRSYGVDAAVPLPWLTLKAEAAYFQAPGGANDEYALYVIQAERQVGDWLLIGGYAGEVVTERSEAFPFAPDRGIARSFLGRAAYTIDANQSFAIETAVRLHGAYVKTEYSRLIGQHWRATAGFVLLAGEDDDFLGQYRRNSHGFVALRYSF